MLCCSCQLYSVDAEAEDPFAHGWGFVAVILDQRACTCAILFHGLYLYTQLHLWMRIQEVTLAVVVPYLTFIWPPTNRQVNSGNRDWVDRHVSHMRMKWAPEQFHSQCILDSSNNGGWMEDLVSDQEAIKLQRTSELRIVPFNTYPWVMLFPLSCFIPVWSLPCLT